MAADFGQLIMRRMLEQTDISTISELPQIITLAMEMAEQMQDYTGEQKKELVTRSVIWVIGRMDPQNATLWDDCLIATVPHLIDHFVVVSENGIQINAPTTVRQFRCPCPEAFVNWFRAPSLGKK